MPIALRRTALTAAVVLAATATACSPGASGPDDPVAGAVVVSDEPGALEAMADTLSGSLRWQGDLELTLDRAEVTTAFDQLAQELDEPIPDDVEQVLDDLEEYAQYADDTSTHGALADDGSWQVAVDHRGDTWLDMRFGLGEVLDARTTTPDATILARIGWDTLFAAFEEAAEWDVREEMRRTADEGPDADTPYADVLHALADGQWGGLAGTIDLSEFGVAADDLDEQAQRFRREFAGVADRETMLELADEALTVRGYEQRDGLTVATVDLHPRDAAFAIHDLFDDASHLAGARPEDLPETVEGVATVAFDGRGHLVEVRSDVLAMAARALDAEATADARAAAAAIRGLETTSAAVVFTMSDHGQVPTVTDVDAVTMPWGDLAEFFFGGLYEEPATPTG